LFFSFFLLIPYFSLQLNFYLKMFQAIKK